MLSCGKHAFRGSATFLELVLWSDETKTDILSLIINAIKAKFVERKFTGMILFPQ